MKIFLSNKSKFNEHILDSNIEISHRERKFCLYIHIPFCLSRCGYCDFNTYTSAELGGGATQANYANLAVSEIKLAARSLENSKLGKPVISSIFFGGGTPTILSSKDLCLLLKTAEDEFGFAEDVEITTEANPDSVSKDYLEELSDYGFTRISLGMQSAVPKVLKILDRTHQPENVLKASDWAKSLGMQISLDLIYGTPGESVDDWIYSLSTALSYKPDHISAYSLIIEKGTRLANQIKRGVVEDIDSDDQAEKYIITNNLMNDSGYGWYEISNWAKTKHNYCKHNISYWRGDNWWGIGPGAHSHIGSMRWSNVKYPANYGNLLSSGEFPVDFFEVLDNKMVFLEKVLLGIRLKSGLNVENLDIDEKIVRNLLDDGLIEEAFGEKGRKIFLTLRGRLLADFVTRELTVNF